MKRREQRERERVCVVKRQRESVVKRQSERISCAFISSFGPPLDIGERPMLLLVEAKVEDAVKVTHSDDRKMKLRRCLGKG